MKKFLFALALLFSLHHAASAQDGRGKVQSIKVGYLSDRLKLSPEQAERFWPIYNRCSDEHRALRRSYRPEGPAGQDRIAAMRHIDENIEYQEKDLEIRKRCKEDFLKVLSPQQVATLIDAERDFKKMLVDRLRDGSEN